VRREADEKDFIFLNIQKKKVKILFSSRLRWSERGFYSYRQRL